MTTYSEQSMTPTQARIMIVSLVLVAAALAYNATVHRFSVTHLAGDVIVRNDHLTGRSEVCEVDDNPSRLTCGPKQ